MFKFSEHFFSLKMFLITWDQSYSLTELILDNILSVINCKQKYSNYNEI